MLYSPPGPPACTSEITPATGTSGADVATATTCAPLIDAKVPPFSTRPEIAPVVAGGVLLG